MRQINVSKKQMRGYMVRYHGFGEFFELDSNNAMSAIFERIRSIQFDPLNITGARNAELALFSRNVNLTRDDLFDALYRKRELVDAWDKMMCVIKAEDLPKFNRVRQECVRGYELTMNWRGQNDCRAYFDDVLKYITDNGECVPNDIPLPKTNNGGWGPTRIAGVCCEYLWNSGVVCVSRKKGVLKFFDITERLYGDGILDDAFSDFSEFIRWYIRRRISAVGAARLQNGGAWLGPYTEKTETRTNVLNELLERGDITAVNVEGVKSEFYINAEDECFFDERPLPARAIFLAPLDNMIWDRKNLKSLFDFDYSWEVYTPSAKRRFGYYVLPILIGDRFVGRIEPTLGKDGILYLKNIWFESEPNADERDMICAEFDRLATFVNSDPETNYRSKIISHS